jgi:Ca-activated chloride channel family protein
MTFRSPVLLLLLVVVGVVALAYLALQFRRRRYIVLFPNVDAVVRAAPRSALWRRHVTAAVFLLMLTALVVAMARPGHTVNEPKNDAVVVVALDVSRSMEANDVAPTRLAAAKVQASSFIRSMPASVDVGVVVFSQVASVPVQPTRNRDEALKAIRRARPGNGTAIGDAIQQALLALRQHSATDSAAAIPGQTLPNAQIVLLSDGESTTGRSSTVASDAARAAKVRVSTIAVGTARGTVGVEGEHFDVPVVARELRFVARQTNGRFFTAKSAAELGDIYQDVQGRVAYERVWADETASVVLGVLLVGALTLGATLVWAGRVP